MTTATIARTLLGVPVVPDRYLADGTTLVIDTRPTGGARIVLVGTRPLTTLEAAGREARLIVRRGLADVLAWLGQPVENEPTGADILASFAAYQDTPTH